MASTGPDPPGGSGAATCGGQTPAGLSTQTGLGGPDLPLPPGRGPVLPPAAKEATTGPTLPRARGRRPSVGRQPNYHIKYG
jgi:hypothetical protein